MVTRQAKTFSSLLDIEDEIDNIRHLSEAVWMAASDIDDENQSSALKTLLHLMQEKLADARNGLDALRKAGGADV